jgi:hypothetical protein
VWDKPLLSQPTWYEIYGVYCGTYYTNVKQMSNCNLSVICVPQINTTFYIVMDEIKKFTSHMCHVQRPTTVGKAIFYCRSCLPFHLPTTAITELLNIHHQILYYLLRPLGEGSSSNSGILCCLFGRTAVEWYFSCSSIILLVHQKLALFCPPHLSTSFCIFQIREGTKIDLANHCCSE